MLEDSVIKRKRGRPKKELVSDDGCVLLCELYRWINKGYDSACCYKSHLRKIFSDDRQLELQKYFIKHPTAHRTFLGWVNKSLTDISFDYKTFLVRYLSDVFSAEEKQFLCKIVYLCNMLTEE